MKLKILHIIKDDKFSIPMVQMFDMESRLENRAVLIGHENESKYIKDMSMVECVPPDSIDSLLRTADYDVVFFHSLLMSEWKHLLRVPKQKTVIWWMWGYDFYHLKYGVSPFVRTKQYKKGSLFLLKHRRGVAAYWAKHLYEHLFLFKLMYYSWMKKKVIARLDYFNPVLPYEFEAMKKYPYFNAKLFYYKRTIPNYSYLFSTIDNGSIFLGNSATYSNSHADIINKLETLPELRNTIFIPLSYGDGGSIYVNQLKSLIKESKHHYNILTDFIPYDEYCSMLSKSPFMISGVLRQQAMANIQFALRNAVKLFFFRDSDVYKYLKSKGYIVFTIEDIDEQSFLKPLTYEEGLNNYNLNKLETEELNSTFDITIDNLLHTKCGNEC